MSRPKSCKIFIRHKNHICDFIWANMVKDGSIMIGFMENGSEKIQTIFDRNLGQLKSGDFFETNPLINPKITFHQSGYYKLSTNIGLTEDAIDRCTIMGESLNRINTPVLLMEILIPHKLKLSESKVTEKDIILQADDFPDKPWRCSIFAMPKKELSKILENKIKFVSTSVIEFTHALENEYIYLTFTLRVSNEDKTFPDKYFFFVPGEIKWGNKAI